MFDLLKDFRDMVLGFFEAVGEFFTWIGSLISDLVDTFVKATMAAGHAIVWVGQMIPAPALAIFTSIIAVAVIYKFLGREG